MNQESIQLLDRVRTALEAEYLVERELGRGGMATVYLARDIALDRLVAIKVMLPNYGGDDSIQDRFVAEARTVAHLDHPNIVTVYSVKERDGLRFFVMKYIDGRPLDAVIEDPEPLDPAMAAALLSQVAEALHFAHAEGIIHRDVKPSNILLDVRGRPVVTDFGIAKVLSGRSLTVTGSMLGTPAYMSPEQCRGQVAGPLSDQYSLGVLAFEVLARRLPFEGGFWELVHAHTGQAPPPIRDLVPGLDPDLAQTVDRMLSKDPADRWPSLGDVSRRFTAAVPSTLPPSQMRAALSAVARRGRPEPAADGKEGGAAAPEVAAEAPKPAPPAPAAPPEPAGAKPVARTTPTPALAISPPDLELEVGDRRALQVKELSGASLSGATVHWQSEDPSIVAVDPEGVVSALAEGFTKVTASSRGAVGRSQVTVRAAARDVMTLAGTHGAPGSELRTPAVAAATTSDSAWREGEERAGWPRQRVGVVAGLAVFVLAGVAWWVGSDGGAGGVNAGAGLFLVTAPLEISLGGLGLAAQLQGEVDSVVEAPASPPPVIASTPVRVATPPQRTEEAADQPPVATTGGSLPDPVPDAGPSSADIRALTCGDPEAARAILASGLAPDPSARLEAFYRPSGSADQAALQELLDALRSVTQLRVEVQAAGNTAIAQGCEWTMEVDFRWTNAFGQPRNRAVRLRMELEAPRGELGIRRLSGIS